MSFDRFSMKWKFAAGATGLSIALIWVVSLMQTHYLEEDIRANIAAQQFTLVTEVAHDLDGKLLSHRTALELSSGALPLSMLDDPARFREHYASRPAMLVFFDDLILIDATGRVRADYPVVPGRTGISVADREYFKQVMATGKSTISDPIYSKIQSQPIVSMATPLRGADGQVHGVLVGTIRLLRENFLGHIASAKVGNSGYFLILTKGETPVYVIHPNKLRILTPRPPNATPSTTRALAGFEGSLEDTNTSGVRAIFSYRHLKTTGWLLSSALPIEEAYAPIERAKGRTLIVAVLVALLITPVLWVCAWRLFAPLSKLLESINALRSTRSLPPLHTDRADEFGVLRHAFDDLMQEREIVEAKLRRSEQLIRNITDNLPALVCYIDPDHRFQFNNRSYERWLHVPLSEITGKKLDEVYDATVYARLKPDLDRALAGESASFEIDFAGRDGRTHFARGRYRPDLDDNGQVRGVYGLITDFTQLKEAEQSLHVSQRALKRTGELAGVGGWEFDLASDHVVWSDETCRLHDVEIGFRPGLEQTIEFYEPRARPLIEAAVRDSIDHGRPFDLELPLVSATGRRFWARAVGAVEFEDGKATRLVGAFQDVTARKAIEQELTANRQLLQTTLDSIADAVITTDLEGRIRWLNPVAERMTGWPKAEAVGRALSKVFVIVDEETRTAVADPVAACISQGKISGLSTRTLLLSRNGEEFGIEDSASPILDADQNLYGVVLVFHDVSEQRRLSHEMTHRATHDPLTGLVNRAEFEMRLQRLAAAPEVDVRGNALLFIDLDQFKLVNDACGHTVGDQLLKQVAGMMRDCVRSRDTVARLGGDEFGIILEHCGMEHAELIAQKMCDQMEEFRFTHDDRRFRVGTSIGLVPFDDRWKTVTMAMQAADASCYAAKDAGRNRVHVWQDSDTNAKARHGDMQWVSRLEQALDENRFQLYGQRIEAIDKPQDRVHCEVLLRLVEADGSIVLPGAFLPVAERFHMATRIDRWVVREVFDRMENDKDFEQEIGMIAINLSGHSIGDRAFHRTVIDLIRAATFDVRKLCFEITETVAVTNFADAKLFIDEVRRIGVKISLDDFGAGASSFGYLKHLPVDFLKIDGQFITGLLDDALDDAAVRCFREVAKVVGVETIAEFVESEPIRKVLAAIGIDMAQGYLIHRPEPLESMTMHPA